MPSHAFDRLRRLLKGQRHDGPPLQPLWSGESTFGECPVWLARASAVCWLDIPTGCLRSYAPATGSVRAWDTGPQSAGLAVSPDDEFLIVGQAKTLRRFVLRTGTLEPFDTLPDAHPEERVNDLAHDPHGALWVATMHVRGDLPVGRLLRRSPDGRWMTALTGLPIVNGPAFDPVRGVGYVCDSNGRRVLRFPTPPIEATQCAAPHLFVRLTEREGYPDGITVDHAGHLWLAHYEGARVTRYTPESHVAHVIRMPVRNVTSVAIGHGTVFITTARDAAGGGGLYGVPLP